MNMKHIFIFIIAAMLIACSNSEVINTTSPNEANVGVLVTGKVTETVDQTPIEFEVINTENTSNKSEENNSVGEEPEQQISFDGITLTYTEGELIELNPTARDPDGDRVSYTFSTPLSREGKWQTKIGDEGNYLVEITATDGDLETQTNVLIIIERANRPPIIDCNDEAVLREGERFYVGDYCKVSDPDDEEVVVYYSGWPGVSRYVTTYDDAGRHKLLITANDKTHIVREDLPIRVVNVNRAPEFPEAFPQRIIGMEGDIITIDTSQVIDPDGDTLRFTFSEPFDNKGVWRTQIGDAGSKEVDVVVSDGETTNKRTVTIELRLANTKPVLRPIQDIVVDEGETVRLVVSATDRENDPLTTTVTGWMKSTEYTTNYNDAGEYSTKVTVSDGEFETSQIVHITVRNVNRPPEFINVEGE